MPPEIRNPMAEARKKPETRNPKPEESLNQRATDLFERQRVRDSDFGLLAGFGLRVSVLGFRAPRVRREQRGRGFRLRNRAARCHTS